MQIELDHLNLHRGGRHLLHDINWQIRPGERWLVIGASGAGKTQLMKIVAGDVWPDDAATATRRYRLDNEWHEQPADVRDELVWLGPERQDRYERYGWNHSVIEVVGTGLHRTDIPLEPLTARQTATCQALLKRAGILRLASRRFLELSYGQRRLVLLARALAWRSRFLLLDEVATGLDERNRQRLYGLLRVRGPRRQGWICSAHREEDIPAGATHLLWIDAGRVQHAGRVTAARLHEALKAAQSQGAQRATRLPVTAARARPSRKPAPRTGRPLVAMSDAQVWIDGRSILQGVQFEVRRGECWVVHGANGSGKSTLLRTIYGDHPVAVGGRITRAGMAPGVPLEVFRARTGFVAPHLQTDYPRDVTVLDTVVSGLHSSIGLNFRATPAENRRARAALLSLGLEDYAQRTLAEMSYGQVRRVLFARALVTNPRLLLLDESLTGLNATVRGELLAWIEARIRAGTTVVMATHYRREWPANATHELMLSRGRVAYAGKLRP